MIVGTAGHIDHGKTSLVRSLTGIDTDRLQEEKTRGISIELGYAYVPVAAARDGGHVDAGPDDVLGFVDVPGHERFVHTMVAGASGIDFALLVVAADDGPMPQTREHLAILALLGITRGAVALTKVDRTDADQRANAHQQLQSLLAGSTLQAAPVFEVVATDPDDAGIQALRKHLHAEAAAADTRRQDASAHALVRMSVDRAFSLPGHGTMAAGMLQGGRISSGDMLQVLPQGMPVRVRSLHAQNRDAQTAQAGQRTALNLAGIDRDAIRRGDWIAADGALAVSQRVDARLRLLQDTPLQLRNWLPLHVHWGSSSQVAHLVLLEPDHADRRDCLVQLVFDNPVCIPCGSRFIARDAQAAHTVGGGVMLDPDAPERRRRSASRLAWLTALEQLHADGALEPVLLAAPTGIARTVLARHAGRQPDALSLPENVLSIGTRGGDWIIHRQHWTRLQAQVLQSLDDLHQRQPDAPGFDSGRLRRACAPVLDPQLWLALLDSLLADGRVQRNGHWLHLPGREPRLDDDERQRLDMLSASLHAGAFDPPWVRDLGKQHGIDEQDVRQLLRKGAAMGELFQVVQDLFYTRARVEELMAVFAAVARNGIVLAADFRDAVGLGRKRSIQILEFFNRIGFTRRSGDQHRLRDDSGWSGSVSRNAPE